MKCECKDEAYAIDGMFRCEFCYKRDELFPKLVEALNKLSNCGIFDACGKCRDKIDALLAEAKEVLR